ncbi:MAG: hypothetical protein LIO59_01140, partial [Oscillospiraceae bacterium]|nr:hypothetical protein [Oscillospiraceae bacterium]
PEKIAEAVGFKTGDLFRMGSASTLRSSLMWDKSTEICLDKTTYFDVTDYEIEIEYSGTLDKQLIEKLKTLGVQFRESSVGKLSRFLRKFEESNKK